MYIRNFRWLFVLLLDVYHSVIIELNQMVDTFNRNVLLSMESMLHLELNSLMLLESLVYIDHTHQLVSIRLDSVDLLFDMYHH